ncbi:hypothetical protein [Photobacterium atrarenae]|uniref:HNH endonuclease n=1 Tax=Photobacterium atrarenae TaxID=865757 RepID=A0ABY5GC30_9GAMM|nr:hypothetical protein [Photobacterium atrarenae]UTV26478.1 hypothetical protein NNL38_08815 [Photobacterium atrarenae]
MSLPEVTGNYAVGTAEVLLAGAVNTAVSSFAGLAGIVDLALGGDLSSSAALIEKIQANYSYIPGSTGAQMITEDLAEYVNAYEQTMSAAGDSVLDATGSPLAATLTHKSVEIAATLVGGSSVLKSAKGLKVVPNKAPPGQFHSNGLPIKIERVVDAKPELSDVTKGVDDVLTESGNVVSSNTKATIAGVSNKIHIPDGINVARFEGLVDEFAGFRSARGFNKWKQSLVDEGLTQAQIQEAVYQGSLKRGENLWKGDWKRYYEEISGTQYPGQPSHAHHLVEKGSSSPAAIENRSILEEVGINPLLNRENLTWAPNITGQHGAIPQGQLLELLAPVRGDRDEIINVLQ